MRGLRGPALGLVLLAAVALPRLTLFPVNENYLGDAAVRTELAERWAGSPRWLRSFGDGAFQFGPLHLYAVGAALRLGAAREDAGRYVALLAGLLSLWPLTLLARRAGGLRGQLWAGLGFAAWGLHIQLSTTAASEALAVLLLLSTLALWTHAAARRQVGWLFASALTLNCLMATRYDAWLLWPLLALAIRFAGLPAGLAWRWAALFFLTCAVFPVAWMVGNYLDHRDALYPLAFVEAYHRRWYGEELARVGNPWALRLDHLLFLPRTLLLTLTPGLALLGAVGMWRRARRSAVLRWVAVAAVAPAAYFTVRAVVLGTFVPLERFFVGSAALMLPFVGPGAQAMLAVLTARVRRTALCATVALAVGTPLGLGVVVQQQKDWRAAHYLPVSPVSVNPPAVRQVATALRELANEGAVVLDAGPHYLDVQITFFANLPTSRLLRARFRNFEARLSQEDPRRVVVLSGGKLEAKLEENGRILRLGAFTFERAFELPGAGVVYRRAAPVEKKREQAAGGEVLG